MIRAFASFSAIAVLASLGACAKDPATRAGTDAGNGGTVISTPMDDGGKADGSMFSDASAFGDASIVFCGGGVCDPVDPSSCDVMTCSLAPSGPVCMAAGPGDKGASCTDALGCLPGLACFRAGAGGVCAEVCCDERGDLCAGPNERCGGTGVLVDGTATPWRQCVARRPCDPLAPAAVCEPGEACYVVSDQGDTDCRLEGSGALGDTCTESTDCGEGLVCAGLVGSTCKRICEVGQGGCSGGESCVQQVYTPAGRGVCTKG